jgi:hypothetical protein
VGVVCERGLEICPHHMLRKCLKIWGKVNLIPLMDGLEASERHIKLFVLKLLVKLAMLVKKL